MEKDKRRNAKKIQEKERSQNTGITLIALIITIIVMLILAGVSFNAIVGENGVLTQATTAATTTDIAGIKEEIETELIRQNRRWNIYISRFTRSLLFSNRQ